MIMYVGEVSMDTVFRFKWAILGLGAAALGLVVWVIYLKFLLAKKSMDSQVEVDKHRLELEYKHGVKTAAIQVEHQKASEKNTPLMGWYADDVVGAQPDKPNN